MPKSVKAPKKAEPVYCWPFKSSQPRGGTIISYVAQLNEDGSLSCNCPGWIFAKKNQERACKHTKLVVEESKDVWKKWKNGEELPLIETEAPAQSMDAGHAAKADRATSRIGKYGRFVSLD